ncbi:hypothetical protein ILUMI_20495 [Ignelater luminosus]|uniref:Uncharacterized protein n=1 Tax=Ignelater luminosus TaxID=2038154 RepID=A0A8K0CI60_IGNLU|nr:hypothetical protein ILUMI_20495 [Ignelater luminosus]
MPKRGEIDIWASVASWFFRPSEALPLTTIASNDQISPTCTASSRPLVPSARSSASPATSSGTSPPRPSSTSASALHREEQQQRTERERVFQPPTICTSCAAGIGNPKFCKAHSKRRMKTIMGGPKKMTKKKQNLKFGKENEVR